MVRVVREPFSVRRPRGHVLGSLERETHGAASFEIEEPNVSVFRLPRGGDLLSVGRKSGVEIVARGFRDNFHPAAAIDPYESSKIPSTTGMGSSEVPKRVRSNRMANKVLAWV